MDVEEMFFCVYHVEYRTSYLQSKQWPVFQLLLLIIAMRLILTML